MARYRRSLLMLILLPALLACSAAVRFLGGGRSQTGAGRSSSAIGLPDAKALQTEDSSCPAVTESILRAAEAGESAVWSGFPGMDAQDELYVPLVTYSVRGDALSEPVLASVPDKLLRYQRDAASQRSAWELFTALIPLEQRAMLTQFQIVTDGLGGVLSTVEQTAEDARTWALEVDIADVPDRSNLAFTLLHEFGHLLTLSPSQVPPDLQLFNDPYSRRLQARAVKACPNFFPGEGCSLPDSYINAFFDRFWHDLYDEWSAIDHVEDDDRRDSGLDAFYRRYTDRFVDSYAATSPPEDIAETWTYFLLEPHPDGASIADEKILFFYDYPELITLRTQILTGLCAAKP